MHTYIMSAGYSLRFRLDGYGKPKYLLKINGKKVIDRIIEMLPYDKLDLVFRGHVFFDFMREHNFHRTNVSYKLIDTVTNNVVETSLRAIEDNEKDIIISYNDFLLDWDKHKFKEYCLNNNYDCIVVTCKKQNSITEWKTIFGTLLHKNEHVIKVGEKTELQDENGEVNIITGVYYFKDSSKYLDYANRSVREYEGIGRELYVTDVVDLMLKDGLTVGVYEADKFYCLGTPNDYEYCRKLLEPKAEDFIQHYMAYNV